MRAGRRSGRLGRAAALTLLLALGGCRGAMWALGAALLYEEVPLPAEQVVSDVAYRSDAGADPRKHRLDLFLPEAPAGDWPVVIFVHGGGWTSGDKGLTVGGADVYRNIGRYFATRGIGAAVISYRLQPEVGWPEQVEDVAAALDWVRSHVPDYGGSPRAIFLMGHSAGAQLAAHVALDDAAGVCGWIPVSGAAFDLADPETYALGASPRYYERRFRNGDDGNAWKRAASPLRRIHAASPPALILTAEDDWDSLHRQARLLDEALRRAGVGSRLLEIPGEDHYSVVLALTREDKAAAPALVDFVRGSECPQPAPGLRGAGRVPADLSGSARAPRERPRRR